MLDHDSSDVSPSDVSTSDVLAGTPHRHTSGEITRLAKEFSEGNREAFDRLMPMIYPELEALARGRLRRAVRGRTLETGMLVNELYLKMATQKGLVCQNREHLMAVFAMAMRQVVIVHARRRAAEKRGAGFNHVPLEDHHETPDERGSVLEVDGALKRLGKELPRLERVVECRFFGGLSEEETAEALGVSTRTVQRDWLRARLWLRDALGGEEIGRLS